MVGLFLLFSTFLFSNSYSITIKSSFHQPSNELQQYYYFYNNSNYDSQQIDSLFRESKCHTFQNQEQLSNCNNDATKTVAKLIHEPKAPKDSNIPNCKYELNSTNIQTHYFPNSGYFLQFTIEQSHCFDTSEVIRGGSSFLILARNDRFLVSCGSTDTFNNQYQIKCHIPDRFHQFQSSDSSCASISIQLDFEHFRAFHIRSFPFLNTKLYTNYRICASHSTSSSNLKQPLFLENLLKEFSLDPSHFSSSPSHSIVKGMWVLRDENAPYSISSPSLFPLPLSLIQSTLPSNYSSSPEPYPSFSYLSLLSSSQLSSHSQQCNQGGEGPLYTPYVNTHDRNEDLALFEWVMGEEEEEVKENEKREEKEIIIQDEEESGVEKKGKKEIGGSLTFKSLSQCLYNLSSSHPLSSNSISLSPTWTTSTSSTSSSSSLSTSTNTSLYRHQHSTLIGESHMRYTWDYLSTRYEPLLLQPSLRSRDLPQKHGDMKENPSFSLVLKYFFPVLGKYLEDSFLSSTDYQSSSSSSSSTSPSSTLSSPPHRHSIAIQTGSWDLNTLPLRGILINPHFADYFLSVLSRLLQNNNNNQTKDQQNSPPSLSHSSRVPLHIVLVLTMSYPDCHPSDSYCLNTGGHRNDYSMAALNQYLLQSLLSIKPSSSSSSSSSSASLHIIDTTPIIRPNRRQHLCISHYICRHGPALNHKMMVAQSGKAIADETLRSMCQ